MKAKSKIVRVLTKAENAVFCAEKIVSMLLLIVMALATGVNVVMRYFFHMTLLVGIDELINWTFVWLVFIGIGMLLKQGGHIGLEFFLNSMPVPMRKAGTVLVDSCLIGMSFIIINASIPFVKSQMSILTTSANIPKAYLYLAVPVGMCLFSFHLIVRIVRICFSDWNSQDFEESENV